MWHPRIRGLRLPALSRCLRRPPRFDCLPLVRGGPGRRGGEGVDPCAWTGRRDAVREGIGGARRASTCRGSDVPRLPGVPRPGRTGPGPSTARTGHVRKWPRPRGTGESAGGAGRQLPFCYRGAGAVARRSGQPERPMGASPPARPPDRLAGCPRLRGRCGITRQHPAPPSP